MYNGENSMIIGSGGLIQYADDDVENEKYLCAECDNLFPESKLIPDMHKKKWTGHFYCIDCYKKLIEEEENEIINQT